uniref:Uncharacterized protein n=1 Tax=Tanacetum cinerariifolium TaxID=118510 RepID=A0A6L2KHB3_TANCI|nr:hypothetical protein [Tanacetum cinerariifolium]
MELIGNMRVMLTKAKLALEQSQQGASDEVLVSIKEVEERKRSVRIKGLKKKPPIHLGRNQVNTYAIRITKMIVDIEDSHPRPMHPSAIYQSPSMTYPSTTYQLAPVVHPPSAYTATINAPPTYQFAPAHPSLHFQLAPTTNPSPAYQYASTTHHSLSYQSSPTHNRHYMANDPCWKTDNGFRSNYLGEVHRRILAKRPDFAKIVYEST